MSKNIQEVTRLFYPEDGEMELRALQKFVESHCDRAISRTIYNALVRGNIRSISDLHNISVEELIKKRDIGSKRMEKIKYLKRLIIRYLEET